MPIITDLIQNGLSEGALYRVERVVRGGSAAQTLSNLKQNNASDRGKRRGFEKNQPQGLRKKITKTTFWMESNTAHHAYIAFCRSNAEKLLCEAGRFDALESGSPMGLPSEFPQRFGVVLDVSCARAKRKFYNWS